jgi:hypothetical protein
MARSYLLSPNPHWAAGLGRPVDGVHELGQPDAILHGTEGICDTLDGLDEIALR